MTARSTLNGQPIFFDNAWRWTDTGVRVNADLRDCQKCVDKEETIERINNLIVRKLRTAMTQQHPINAIPVWEILEALNGDQS